TTVLLPTTLLAADPLTLKLQFKQGEVRRYDFTTLQNATQEIGGVKQDVQQSSSLRLRLEVQAVSEAGDATIAAHYERATLKSNSGQFSVDYNSDTTAAGSTPGNPLPDLFESLIGRPFTFTLTPMGEVKDVKGYKEALEASFAATRFPETPPMQALRAQLQQQFTEDQLRNLLGRLSVHLPQKAVKQGDSWTKEVVLSQGIPMAVKSTFTLEKATAQEIYLRQQGTVTPNTAAPPLVHGSLTLKPELNGTETGTTTLDRASSWPVRASSQQDVQGSFHVTGLPDEQTAKIPLTVKTEMGLVVLP
ncbi:MAG TPA: DUF6263 family protein, partial [Salinarimonas sp.]|nr:DUF6263 family protein [Salinarimonas sp.]